MSTVRDVHTRTFPAPARTVGALIDRLGDPDDPIFPTPAWSPMRFDRPLSVGADGGHGPVRYRVTAHHPGRHIRFDFTDGTDGFHEITVHPLGPDRCRVEHLLAAEMRGARLLLWYAAVRAAHRTVVEEVLDNIERIVTGTVRAPVRTPRRARLLNRLERGRPQAVALPAAARLARTAFPRRDFEDAWQLPLLPGMPRDPAAWRDTLRGAAFAERARAERELLLGTDGRLLDFRASLLVTDDHVTLGTVVRLHDAHRPAARLRLALTLRGHTRLAPAMLRRTYHRLALAAPSAGERERQRIRLREQADEPPRQEPDQRREAEHGGEGAAARGAGTAGSGPGAGPDM